MTALLGPAAAAADLSSGGLSTSLSLATTAANTLVGLAAYVAATQTVQAHAHAQAQVQMHAQAQMPFTAAAPGPTAIPLPEVGGYGTGAGMTGLAGLGVDTRKGMGAWKRDMDDYTTSSDILPT